MSLRSYLAGLMFSTALCWVGFVFVIFYINPEEASTSGLVAFYLSLLFAMTGTFVLIGFYMRVWLSKNEVIYAHISPSFRQGFFLSLIVVISLVLQAFRILSWWDGILLVGSVVLLEFYFMSRRTV